MKKINLLKSVLLFLINAILLLGCRTEDVYENSSQINNKAIQVSKIYPNEFQSTLGLNDGFNKSEKILSKRLIIGKGIMDEATIDSSFAMKTTDGISVSYTFPVYRNNQKDFIENLVIQKKMSETDFKSYLYRYKRVGITNYDANNLEIYNLNKETKTTGKLLFLERTFNNGCSKITIYSIDCNEGGHHTNGQWCKTLQAYIPYDTVSIIYTC